MKSKIDYQEILKLIDLLEERNLSRFELEVEGFKISIGRGQETQLISHEAAAPPPAQAPGPDALPESEKIPPERDDLIYVDSPMVGTFYRSPDPSSPPFIDKGESIEKNQTLCIIEAMKLMNEIEADVDGVVEEIFVKNGKPVEYGQKLFSIRPQ